MTTLIAALYAISLGVVGLYGVNLYWLAARRASTEALRPGTVPEPELLTLPSEADLPVVTVQLPLYNEALVAERVIDAAAGLRYPRRKLEIQVLDDSTDETSERVGRAVRRWRARGVDIVHLQRTHRTGYKAGALAEGMQSARGTLIALFDADFVPRADFLIQAVDAFSDPSVGVVQARWEHINPTTSLLTRMQAFGLDAHFAVEQEARYRTGCFNNFNGTAGVWRRSAIDDAGGWTSDTLTEDLDLSFRAQLRGWRFVYRFDLGTPSELPAVMHGFRSQQRRWTKGSAQTARKLVGRVIRSGLPWRVRLQGVLHLTANLTYPFVLLLMVLHAPLVVLKSEGVGPSELYFALLGLGVVGFAGFVAAQVAAQRALYADWARRMVWFPLFVSGSMGMALSNTGAIVDLLHGRKTPFVRTPKFDSQDGRHGSAWWRAPYAANRMPLVVWGEAALTLYCATGLILILNAGEWAAVPFQVLFTAGAALVAGWSVRHAMLARRVVPEMV